MNVLLEITYVKKTPVVRPCRNGEGNYTCDPCPSGYEDSGQYNCSLISTTQTVPPTKTGTDTPAPNTDTNVVATTGPTTSSTSSPSTTDDNRNTPAPPPPSDGTSIVVVILMLFGTLLI